jgi:hypothetical protein
MAVRLSTAWRRPHLEEGFVKAISPTLLVDPGSCTDNPKPRAAGRECVTVNGVRETISGRMPRHGWHTES